MILGGNISGAGGITKLGVGQGPVVISGSNTFTGPISVNAGSVKVASLNSVSGGTATSNLGAPTDEAGSTISLGANSTSATLTYTGPGETTDRVIKMGGTTGGAIITQSGTSSGLPTTRGTSGLLKFTSNLAVPGTASGDNRKTLTLTSIVNGDTGPIPGQGEMGGNIGDSLLGTTGQRATSITKAGVGTWTLSGSNTYSGVTLVQKGTLAIARAEALGTNTLDVTDGANVRLDYIGTRQIGMLTFNAGAAQPTGSYGSSASPATTQDDLHFSGLGTVTIGSITSPTTTMLARTGGSDPSAAGNPLTFTATVTGSVPTGQVIFYDGLIAFGTNSLNGSFQTSVSVSGFAGGIHTLKALYVGNGANSASASEPFSQTVTEARLATTTTVTQTSGANPSERGSSVTFTATVTGASPSGTVTFYDNTTVIGSGTLNGSGQASLAISSLAPGVRMIIARYAGDVNNAPSASAAFQQTVNPSPGNGKVKVFILAGQSNMVGKGEVEKGRNPNDLYGANIDGGLGSLRNMLNSNPDKYGYLADPAHPIPGGSPGWMTRADVWVTYYGGATYNITPPAPTPPYYTTVRHGDLDANFGQNAADGQIGPEYGFGVVVGSQLADQVLIIKYAHGGRSLAVDFRPPTSVAQAGGTVGPCYNEMVGVVTQVLNNIAAEFPAYTGGGYEVIGLGWHQGWNDRIVPAYVAEYETNMVNLIKDLRTAFTAPNMLVSIGSTGMANADSSVDALNLITAQENVADPVRHPELAGTVATVDTRSFDLGTLHAPSSEGYHWNWSGESYFNIGEQMGMAMVEMLTPAVPNIPPIIAEGVVTNVVMSEDGTPQAFSLTLNASDSDGGTLTWSISSNGLLGTASVLGTGSPKAIGYTPIANANGSDSFIVQVSDGQGGTDTILVNVTILPENDAPTTNGIVTTQTVTDSDMNGSQVVTLDASAALDDGSIVSYTWSEGAVQLATGAVVQVPLPIGVHIVTLEIMDNDGLVSTLHLTLTVIAQSAYLMEDFEHEWLDNALANSTNQWSSSGASDISSITNPAVGYSRLPFDVPFPLVYNHATQRRVLQVNTLGDLLLTPVLEANFSSKKVYVDMMVKFGLCETLPFAMTNELNVKASMFLHKNGSSTNLVVFHGQKTEGGFGTSTFTPVADGFDSEAWYRLTLTFDATTNNSGAEAFSVRINGDPLISSQAYGDSWKSLLFQSPIPDGGTWFLSASRRLEATGTNLTTVTGLSFEGEGFVDDLVVTPYQPVFGCGTVIMLALCTGNSGMIQELMAL